MTITNKSLKQESCFLGIGNDNLGRWPTKFSERTFRDKSFLYEYLCRNNINMFPEKLFLHSGVYFVRAHLENKFNRFFSSEEIMKIIKDKSWQWRTSEQTIKYLLEQRKTRNKSHV